jgi:hypothetical protein
MVSKIDGSMNIRSVATSSISRSLLGSSGASRSTIPMPKKSTYWRFASSITSSMVTAPAGDEGSTAPAAGDGSDTSAAGERSGTNDIATS